MIEENKKEKNRIRESTRLWRERDKEEQAKEKKRQIKKRQSGRERKRKTREKCIQESTRERKNERREKKDFLWGCRDVLEVESMTNSHRFTRKSW